MSILSTSSALLSMLDSLGQLEKGIEKFKGNSLQLDRKSAGEELVEDISLGGWRFDSNGPIA